MTLMKNVLIFHLESRKSFSRNLSKIVMTLSSALPILEFLTHILMQTHDDPFTNTTIHGNSWIISDAKFHVTLVKNNDKE